MLKPFICLMLLCVCLSVTAQIAHAAGNSPAIVSFSSDLQSITPDEAESGTKMATLAWSTTGLRTGDQVYLQVFVLDQWHDIQKQALPASGTLRWAVAHTLDFKPPQFRLEIRDKAGQSLTRADLVIPYLTGIDPANPPKITWFSIGSAPAPAGLVRVSWRIKNRPARANLRFVQILDDNSAVNIEQPRAHQWINSQGQGAVRPITNAKVLQVRLEIFDIDTQTVYDQYLMSVPWAALSGPMPTAVPTQASNSPEVIALTADHFSVKRGDTITVSWQTRRAMSANLKIYAVDAFVASMMHPDWHPPYTEFKDLKLSDSLTITVPKDIPMSGWTFLLTAEGNQSNGNLAGSVISVLFTDVPQPTLLDVQQFTITPPAAKRGDSVTISWRTRITVRGVDSKGQIVQLPTNGYENQIWLSAFPVLGTGDSPASSLSAHFTGQPLVGSIQWTVPDFDVAFGLVMINLGLNENGQENTYSVQSLELVLATPVTDNVKAAYQAFQHGFMIWNGKTGEILVFGGSTSGGVYDFPQPEYASNPDNPVADNPPPGLVKPISGFGRVWGNNEPIRSMLGWALGQEQGYTMTITYGSKQPTPDVIYSLPNAKKVHQTGGTWVLVAN